MSMGAALLTEETDAAAFWLLVILSGGFVLRAVIR
jgi:hypothetical protein